MSKKIFFIFYCIIALSCEKKEIIQLIPPDIFVSTAYLISNGSTIEVNCETINPSSVIKEEFGICWSENPNPKKTDNYQYSGNNSAEEGPFTEQILKIKPNTKYYIRGYMRVGGKDIYSDDFIFEPVQPAGWKRLADVPRDLNIINLPIAYLQSNSTPTFRRKIMGFEQAIEYSYNTDAQFWSKEKTSSNLFYDQFFTDIEYAPGKFDFLIGGGYYIENAINGKKKYLKTASTNTFNPIENYPGADFRAVGFGAGNKGFVIEVKPNPKMYAFNEDNYLWEQMKDPPFNNFTNIKATRAAENGLIILENSLESESKLRVYNYDFKTDTWTQLPDFPGRDRLDGVLFSIKTKVYFGLGTIKSNESGLKDFWEYDINTGKWIQLANYPGGGSSYIAYVKKGNSVYLGMGYTSLLTQIGTSKKFMAYDFWEFRP